MSTLPQPRIRILSHEECKQVLSGDHVGRIGPAWGSLDGEPPHHVFEGGCLYGHTSREPG